MILEPRTLLDSFCCRSIPVMLLTVYKEKNKRTHTQTNVLLLFSSLMSPAVGAHRTWHVKDLILHRSPNSHYLFFTDQGAGICENKKYYTEWMYRRVRCVLLHRPPSVDLVYWETSKKNCLSHPRLSHCGETSATNSRNVLFCICIPTVIIIQSIQGDKDETNLPSCV